MDEDESAALLVILADERVELFEVEALVVVGLVVDEG